MPGTLNSHQSRCWMEKGSAGRSFDGVRPWHYMMGCSTTCSRNGSSPSPVAPWVDTGPMDSPLVTQIFRQLFSHRASQCLARGARPALSAHHARIQRRCMASRVRDGETTRESRWTPRKHTFPNERTEEFDRYPMVTSEMLKSRRERPRRVKMLLRDFIEGQEIQLAHAG